MKYYFIIGCLTIGMLFCSCGGKHLEEEQQPEDIIEGVKEIQKGAEWYRKGCYNRALEYFFKGHEIFTATDRTEGVALSLNNIGNVYRAMGDAKSAAAFYDEAYAIYSDRGDVSGKIQALSNKAAALIDDDNYAAAETVIASAEALAAGAEIVHVPLLKNRGILYIKQKDYDKAEKLLKQCRTLTYSEKYAEFAAVNYALGKLMNETHRSREAISYLELALTADKASAFYEGIADDLKEIAVAYQKIDEPRKSAFYYSRSIKIYALLGKTDEVESIREQIKIMAEEHGMDMTVTYYFIRRWLEGKAMESPCE